MRHRDDDHAIEGYFGAADAISNDGLTLSDLAEEPREQDQHAEENADGNDTDEEAAFEQQGEWESGVHMDDLRFLDL
jgi:hypothetical protein